MLHFAGRPRVVYTSADSSGLSTRGVQTVSSQSSHSSEGQITMGMSQKVMVKQSWLCLDDVGRYSFGPLTCFTLPSYGQWNPRQGCCQMPWLPCAAGCSPEIAQINWISNLDSLSRKTSETLTTKIAAIHLFAVSKNPSMGSAGRDSQFMSYEKEKNIQ